MPQKLPSQPRIFTRRIIGLGATGAAIAADRLGLFDVFDGEKDPQQNPAEKTITQEVTKPNIPEYKEWASKIELPEINLDEVPLDWGQEELENYFLPQDIDKGQLVDFYRKFDNRKEALIRLFAQQTDPRQRLLLVSTFLLGVIQDYKALKGDRTPIQRAGELQVYLPEINPLLIPHGFWMEHENHPKEGPSLKIFETGDIQKLEAHINNQSLFILVIFLKGETYLPIYPQKKPSRYKGRYGQNGNYIVIDQGDKKGPIDLVKDFRKAAEEKGVSMPNVDESTYLNEFLKMTIFHEGMHGVFHKTLGVRPYQKSVLRKGPIDMGSYRLKEKEYQAQNNFSIHELAAEGYGLLNSGEISKFVIWSMILERQERYQFVRNVLIAEIFHSKFVDEEIRQEYTTNNFNEFPVTLFRALLQISDEELHHIGQRMAKLAIYLTQEE